MTRLKSTRKKSAPTLDSRYWVSFASVALLCAGAFFTSVGVIYSKHKTRQLFSELQILQSARDDLHVEWSQLLLEQGTWATDVRVERVAREHLSMLVPLPTEMVLIQE